MSESKSLPEQALLNLLTKLQTRYAKSDPELSGSLAAAAYALGQIRHELIDQRVQMRLIASSLLAMEALASSKTGPLLTASTRDALEALVSKEGQASRNPACVS